MEVNGLGQSLRLQAAGLAQLDDYLPDLAATAAIDAQPAAVAAPVESVVAALVGMAFEARIAAGPGVLVMCRDSEHELSATLTKAVNRGCRNIISFGVAGGLAPHLRPGDWIVASSIVDSKHVRPTDESWSKRLLEMMPGAGHAPIAGVDTAVTHPKDKRQLHVATGAATVDIESHLVARLASNHGLNFAAVRVVIDPAHRVVPGAALAGMQPGGGTSVMAVLRALMARPSELAGLLRVCVDAYTARSALLRARRMLGPHFGFADTGKA
jgi:hopanoid-associated phosphorylase